MRKIIGLALAVVALSTGVATSAQGAQFNSEASTTTVVGNQTGSHVFNVAGMKLTCKKAHFEATVSGKIATEVTVTPSYSECSFLFFNVNINMNGCSYRFHSNGEVDIVGASCKGIVYEAAGCKFVVPAQTGLGKVVYTTLGSGTTRHIEVKPNITGIKNVSSGICAENGTSSNGKYEAGTTDVSGFSGGVQVGIFFS